jgi:ergothioneine biosynthesis protein EgtB
MTTDKNGKTGQAPAPVANSQRAGSLAQRYSDVRSTTLALTEGLSDADATVQSMEDASPAKWHLAHTTWFFETIVLKQFDTNYAEFNSQFAYLFNSYYEALGDRQPRPRRGMITRPSLQEVLAYRHYVDEAIADLTARPLNTRAAELIELGINHEQQHQELLLTDILHLFTQHPFKSSYRPGEPIEVNREAVTDLSWIAFDGGTFEFGHQGLAFAFDCESPQHERLLEPFALASRCVTNREWIDFMEDGGYGTAALWLSDGWSLINAENWQTPFYWEMHEDAWWSMTLRGFQPVDLDAPVTHVSYFEADAFAAWTGKRLPTEFEWEQAARQNTIEGNLLSSNRLRPAPAIGEGLHQMFGDVWEWTASPYVAYPRFRAADGAVGEYNGKFMNGQYVLRGGSCVTPDDHLRSTYRNFFQPEKRWQFSGLRLAEDR